MFNEVSGLVFKKLKAKIEELGRRGFQLQKEFPPLRGGYEFRGLISYDTDSCNNDEEPMIMAKRRGNGEGSKLIGGIIKKNFTGKNT